MSEPRENVAADETQRFERYAQELVALQSARAKGKPLTRALHVKRHAGAVGELVVKGGLDPALAQGMFAPNFGTSGGRYAVYVRFSNGGGRISPDTVNEIRGVGVKVVGIPGKKLIHGLEDCVTQDFLFIQTPVTAVRDPDEFMTVVRTAAGGPLKLLLGIAKAHGIGRMISVAKLGSSMKRIVSMATGTFYTAAPIRWGNTAAKLCIVPMATGDARGTGRNSVRDDIVARLKDGPVVYSLRAQLYVDDKLTPIEDGSAIWPESKTPYREVATLTLHQQDVGSPRGQEIEDIVEAVSFDPWHSIEEHRPMGAMMRARKSAYKASVVARGPVDEPTSVLSPHS